MGKKSRAVAPKIRELFIEELAEVQGGSPENPVKDLVDKLLCCSTMACCEEGACCADPI